MRFVVGLGNPGRSYADTRHNFGFLCLEELSRRWRQLAEYRLLEEGERPQVAYWERWSDPEGHEVALLWPLTYMNLCGQALGFLAARLGSPERDDLLVVVDDMSLPLGQLRLRGKGSSGGHNGLKSLQSFLGDVNYPRLRLGIGQPGPEREVVDFVLSPFDSGETAIAQAVVSFAAAGIQEWTRGVSFDLLVGKVNGWRWETPG
jgi:PTH1 family peptidyl-tRNA hydrolase